MSPKKQRQRDGVSRLVAAKEEGGGGGREGEFGISICKLEWINNKVLPYITENYIQYLAIKP